MFEGAISAATVAEGAPGTLRALDWSEIVARLGAARDLRAVFSRPASPGGSFAFAAGIVAGERREPDVNLAALASGKWVSDKSAATADPAAQGDRDS